MVMWRFKNRLKWIAILVLALGCLYLIYMGVAAILDPYGTRGP